MSGHYDPEALRRAIIAYTKLHGRLPTDREIRQARDAERSSKPRVKRGDGKSRVRTSNCWEYTRTKHIRVAVPKLHNGTRRR